MKQHNPLLSAGLSAAVSKRRVFIKSYGCQMNVYDSTRMADVLEGEGYVETADPAEADAIILNTCHIREKAAEKVYSELGKLKALKRERAERGLATQIAVAGCVAQAEGAEIIKRQPAVDLVFGPQSYHRLPQLLGSAAAAPGIVDTDFPVEDKFEALPAPSSARLIARGVSAFVTVQEGCDKFCAFCVVPYTRGAEVSRPVAGVLAEVLDLVSAGVSEITLIGQNVNAYHGHDSDGRAVTLAGLIARVAAVEGVSRVRYMTSHPNDMDDDLIACHGTVSRLMPYLHLPVQSGSDRILAAMNRKHTAAAYLRLVERIRAARPDIAFSSDFIVGFPGETDADFQATLELVEAVGFASAYSFKYSPRPGTPAALLTDPVPEEKMKERLAVLQALLDDQRRAFNESMVGRRLDVLFEKQGRHPGQITGKSPYLQPVHVTGSVDLLGRTASVEITKLMSNSLAGRLAEELDGPSVRTSP